MDTKARAAMLELFKDLHGHPRFYELLADIAILHSNKNADYAADNDPLSNLRECEKFGIPAWKGALVRITDKISRITQLASGKEARVKDERIEDTLQDLAVYALLTKVLYEELVK